MTTLNDIYSLAIQNDVQVLSHELPILKTVSHMDDDGNCYIAIDYSLIISEREEKLKVAHELGHCATGAFYNRHMPILTRAICEARADRWAINHLIPRSQLEDAAQRGIVEVWELAEYFEVSEDFMRRAINFYQNCR